MPRIDDRTWEHSPEELIVAEIHERLVDQGHDSGTALLILSGARVPESLRSPAPNLERVLTPEFRVWLSE